MSLNEADLQALDQFIGRLYRAAASISPAEFRRWALTELKQHIRFDAAVWSNGHQQSRTFHNHTLIKVTPDFVAQLIESQHENPLVNALIANLGKPVDARDVQEDNVFYQSPMYVKCFSRMGIERILSSIHVDDRSGLFTLLSLYRHQREDTFSERDKHFQARALFHLLNASSHAFFLHVNQQQADNKPSYRAICDATGKFHEVQAPTLDLLAQYFPDQSLHTLPFSLPDAGSQHTIEGLCIRTSPLDDLFLLELWPTGPLDELTEREKQVVLSVSQGKTFKQIAKELSLSPSTVSNHLYRVYQKLAVNNRHELAALINDES